MRRYSYEIALSAIGAALAIIAVVAQAYVSMMTIALNVIAALAINLPLTRDMWKGGIMAYIVTSLVTFLIVNVKALPFIMLFGAYSLIMWLLDFRFYPWEKFNNKPVKIVIITLVKTGYFLLAFWGCYKLMGIVVDTAIIFGKEFSLNFYIVWGVCFVVFCLYDPFIRWVYKNEKILVDRIVKKKN